jgi:hypothetical protein
LRWWTAKPPASRLRSASWIIYSKDSKRLLIALLAFTLTEGVRAGADESETAVARILFDADTENASYSIRRNGFVDILFGPSVSDVAPTGIVTVRSYTRFIDPARFIRDSSTEK